MEKVILTVPEMADKLGIGLNKAYAIVPQIPHLKIGRQIRIPIKSFDEWLINKSQKERRL